MIITSCSMLQVRVVVDCLSKFDAFHKEPRETKKERSQRFVRKLPLMWVVFTNLRYHMLSRQGPKSWKLKSRIPKPSMFLHFSYLSICPSFARYSLKGGGVETTQLLLLARRLNAVVEDDDHDVRQKARV